MSDTRTCGLIAGLVAGVLLCVSTAACALDTIRLGKAVPNSFAFGAAEVGIEAKIFESEGLDVAISSFRGDAQMQQALAAGSLDVGLGSGPGLGFRVKGAPMIGVAAMYGAPRNLALLIPAKSPIKSVAELKGKRIGVTTAGSLTDWVVRELSRQQGWGSQRHRDRRRSARCRRGLPPWIAASSTAACRRPRTATSSRRAGRTRNLHPVRRHREAFLHARDLRHRRHGRQAAGAAAAFPARAGSDRRLHEGEPGVHREVRAAHARRAPKHRRENLRRPDGRLLAGRRLGPGGDRRDPRLAQGAGHPAGVPDAKALYTDKFVPVRF